MKILVISHEYPPIGGGGGKVVQDLCEGIVSTDHSFHIVTALWDDLPEFEKSGHLIIERIRSHRTQAFRAGLAAMACFVWKSFWRSLQIIRNWHPDIIHAHFAVPGGASAALAGLITRTPYLITAHGGDVPGGAPGKTKKWFRFILPFTHFIWNNASRIVTISQRSRQLAQIHYPVKIDVIPNGINTSQYQILPLEIHDPPCIVFIGRFSPEKNALFVPHILSQLKELRWKCIMVGDGPQMGKVQSLITEFQLENRVSVMGWINPDQVNRILSESDILLMPSFQEGMPMTGLQGLASGTALVMSAVGACPEMVNVNKNGFLVKQVNWMDMCNHCAHFYPTKIYYINLKLTAVRKQRNLTLLKVVTAYKNVYRSILKVNE